MTEIVHRTLTAFDLEGLDSRDTDKNVLVYLVWSTELIDGSPFNSITAIPLN